MPKSITLDGVTWTRHAASRCLCCQCRTYRISARIDAELRWAPGPGANGSNTINVQRPDGTTRQVTVCTQCLTQHFDNDPMLLRGWALQHPDGVV